MPNNKKKNRTAEGKPSKKGSSTKMATQAFEADMEGSLVAAGRYNEVPNKPEKLKTNLKRPKAKAKEQVVKYAKTPMPDKMPRSLFRKPNSPNSDIAKTGKAKQNPKSNSKHVAPVQNSNMENRKAPSKPQQSNILKKPTAAATKARVAEELNYATASALRFKEQIFGSRYK